MHEASLVKRLLCQVDEVIQTHQAEFARAITIEIGPLSGVEPELVISAYDQLAPETRSSGAALTIINVPLRIRCLECEAETELDNFVFRCNQCGSGQVQVVGGDEFRLMTVTIE